MFLQDLFLKMCFLISLDAPALKELSAKHHLPRALDLESVDPEAGKETSSGNFGTQSGNQAISWWTQPWRCVDCRLLSHAMISTIPWQWPFNEKGVTRLGSLTCGPHLMCCPSECRRVPRPSSNWTCTGDRTVEGAASKHETGLGLWVWAW